MAGITLWNTTTPILAPADYEKGYLPVRIAGAAADGSQDTFAQVLFPVNGVPAMAFRQALRDSGNLQAFTDAVQANQTSDAALMWVTAGSVSSTNALGSLLVSTFGAVEAAAILLLANNYV